MSNTQDQKTLNVLIKKTHEDAVVPTTATAGSSGFDLVSVDEVIIGTGNRMVINTGIAISLPRGYEGQVRPRSGLAAKQGLTVLNSPGTIDSDYTGDIKVILYNTGPLYNVVPGDRIAQLVIQQVPQVNFVVTDSLEETDRGAGGFGSTGK